jgi:hypothetical protein
LGIFYINSPDSRLTNLLFISQPRLFGKPQLFVRKSPLATILEL